jgi:tRNA1(Val) A37 N6-methylase TrmN6
VFPLGQDALALGNFVPLRRRERVCDLGTGSGVLLLLLAQREPTLYLTGVELDPVSAQTAQENLTRNHISGEIICGDLREKLLTPGSFDLVVSNPPYFPVGRGNSGGAARSEETCTLEDLCACAERLLKNGGRLAICHRPERLVDVLGCMRGHNLEPKQLKILRHSPEHPPSLILVEAKKGGGPGLNIL